METFSGEFKKLAEWDPFLWTGYRLHLRRLQFATQKSFQKKPEAAQVTRTFKYPLEFDQIFSAYPDKLNQDPNSEAHKSKRFEDLKERVLSGIKQDYVNLVGPLNFSDFWKKVLKPFQSNGTTSYSQGASVGEGSYTVLEFWLDLLALGAVFQKSRSELKNLASILSGADPFTEGFEKLSKFMPVGAAQLQSFSKDFWDFLAKEFRNKKVTPDLAKFLEIAKIDINLENCQEICRLFDQIKSAKMEEKGAFTYLDAISELVEWLPSVPIDVKDIFKNEISSLREQLEKQSEEILKLLQKDLLRVFRFLPFCSFEGLSKEEACERVSDLFKVLVKQPLEQYSQDAEVRELNLTFVFDPWYLENLDIVTILSKDINQKAIIAFDHVLKLSQWLSKQIESANSPSSSGSTHTYSPKSLFGLENNFNALSNTLGSVLNSLRGVRSKSAHNTHPEEIVKYMIKICRPLEKHKDKLDTIFKTLSQRVKDLEPKFVANWAVYRSFLGGKIQSWFSNFENFFFVDSPDLFTEELGGLKANFSDASNVTVKSSNGSLQTPEPLENQKSERTTAKKDRDKEKLNRSGVVRLCAKKVAVEECMRYLEKIGCLLRECPESVKTKIKVDFEGRINQVLVFLENLHNQIKSTCAFLNRGAALIYFGQDLGLSTEMNVSSPFSEAFSAYEATIQQIKALTPELNQLTQALDGFFVENFSRTTRRRKSNKKTKQVPKELSGFQTSFEANLKKLKELVQEIADELPKVPYFFGEAASRRHLKAIFAPELAKTLFEGVLTWFEQVNEQLETNSNLELYLQRELSLKEKQRILQIFKSSDDFRVFAQKQLKSRFNNQSLANLSLRKAWLQLLHDAKRDPKGQANNNRVYYKSEYSRSHSEVISAPSLNLRQVLNFVLFLKSSLLNSFESVPPTFDIPQKAEEGAVLGQVWTRLQKFVVLIRSVLPMFFETSSDSNDSSISSQENNSECLSPQMSEFQVPRPLLTLMFKMLKDCLYRVGENLSQKFEAIEEILVQPNLLEDLIGIGCKQLITMNFEASAAVGHGGTHAAAPLADEDSLHSLSPFLKDLQTYYFSLIEGLLKVARPRRFLERYVVQFINGGSKESRAVESKNDEKKCITLLPSVPHFFRKASSPKADNFAQELRVTLFDWLFSWLERLYEKSKQSANFEAYFNRGLTPKEKSRLLKILTNSQGFVDFAEKVLEASRSPELGFQLEDLTGVWLPCFETVRRLNQHGVSHNLQNKSSNEVDLLLSEIDLKLKDVLAFLITLKQAVFKLLIGREKAVEGQSTSSFDEMALLQKFWLVARSSISTILGISGISSSRGKKRRFARRQSSSAEQSFTSPLQTFPVDVFHGILWLLEKSLKEFPSKLKERFKEQDFRSLQNLLAPSFSWVSEDGKLMGDNELDLQSLKEQALQTESTELYLQFLAKYFKVFEARFLVLFEGLLWPAVLSSKGDVVSLIARLKKVDTQGRKNLWDFFVELKKFALGSKNLKGFEEHLEPRIRTSRYQLIFLNRFFNRVLRERWPSSKETEWIEPEIVLNEPSLILERWCFVRPKKFEPPEQFENLKKFGDLYLLDLAEQIDNPILFLAQPFTISVSVKDKQVSTTITTNSLDKSTTSVPEEKTFIGLDIGEYCIAYCVLRARKSSSNSEVEVTILDKGVFTSGAHRALKDKVESLRARQRSGSFGSVDTTVAEVRKYLLGTYRNLIHALVLKYKARPVYESNISAFETGGNRIKKVYDSLKRSDGVDRSGVKASGALVKHIWGVKQEMGLEFGAGYTSQFCIKCKRACSFELKTHKEALAQIGLDFKPVIYTKESSAMGNVQKHLWYEITVQRGGDTGSADSLNEEQALRKIFNSPFRAFLDCAPQALINQEKDVIDELSKGVEDFVRPPLTSFLEWIESGVDANGLDYFRNLFTREFLEQARKNRGNSCIFRCPFVDCNFVADADVQAAFNMALQAVVKSFWSDEYKKLSKQRRGPQLSAGALGFGRSWMDLVRELSSVEGSPAKPRLVLPEPSDDALFDVRGFL